MLTSHVVYCLMAFKRLDSIVLVVILGSGRVDVGACVNVLEGSRDSVICAEDADVLYLSIELERQSENTRRTPRTLNDTQHSNRLSVIEEYFDISERSAELLRETFLARSASRSFAATPSFVSPVYHALYRSNKESLREMSCFVETHDVKP